MARMQDSRRRLYQIPQDMYLRGQSGKVLQHKLSVVIDCSNEINLPSLCPAQLDKDSWTVSDGQVSDGGILNCPVTYPTGSGN